MSDYYRAMSYYQKIPQNQWSRAEIGLNLALTLKKTGKKAEASQVLDKIAEPKNPNLKKYYAIISKQLGDSE